MTTRLCRSTKWPGTSRHPATPYRAGPPQSSRMATTHRAPWAAPSTNAAAASSPTATTVLGAIPRNERRSTGSSRPGRSLGRQMIARSLAYAQDVSDVMRIELGRSILEGEMIAQAAAEAGLHVQLLRNEHPETGGAFALGTCALLVRSDEETEVRELLAGFRY
jgi:hypothetical protein